MSPKPRLAIVSGPDIDSRLALAKLLANDFDVTLVGSRDFGHDSLDGLAYRSYKLDRALNPFSDLAALVHLGRLLKNLKPDVVQTFSTKPSVLARLAASQAGVPVIVGTIPGLGSIYGDDRVVTRMIRGAYEQVQRLACRVSSVTVFQNADDLAEFVKRGLVRREAATVVPGSGVDTEAFKPHSLTEDLRRRLLTSLELSDSAVVVTMVTRIIRSKGVLDYAEAARLVKARESRAPTFLLIGELDTESREALTSAEWTEVQRHVRCLGTRKDIAALLGITDIFVLPSYYREGIPRALLEAGASANALISTDQPGCRDLVKAGLTGLVVPPRNPIRLAEAISTLANDQDLRIALGARARQLVVEGFDLRAVATMMRDIYFRLLDKERRPDSAEDPGRFSPPL